MDKQEWEDLSNKTAAEVEDLRDKLAAEICNLFLWGKLSAEDVGILALRYGLIGARALTFQEIADRVERHHGDAEEAKQAEADILRKLRLKRLIGE